MQPSIHPSTDLSRYPSTEPWNEWLFSAENLHPIFFWPLSHLHKMESVPFPGMDRLGPQNYSSYTFHWDLILKIACGLDGQWHDQDSEVNSSITATLWARRRTNPTNYNFRQPKCLLGTCKLLANGGGFVNILTASVKKSKIRKRGRKLTFFFKK